MPLLDPAAWSAAAAPLATAAAAASLLFALCGCRSLVDAVAGASRRRPEEMATGLSAEARALLDRAYEGVDRARLLDHHVHVVGLPECGSGCYVNPRMLTWRHPIDRIKYLCYRSAGRIRHEDRAEEEYVARLLSLAAPHGGRLLVLAFDEHRDASGAVVAEKTEFHVPNAYVIELARKHPDRLVAACSVHPLRPGAIEELERCAAAGVRVVKWLPNAMGIDPSDPRHRPFYERMRALDMVLLSHGGEEQAVRAQEDQRLGNPLLLRAPLEAGVKVVCAHFAGLGDDEDLDDPRRPRVASWRLLLRLMEDPRWEGLLFADLSATTQTNRTPEPLRTLLLRDDLHPRLVNGSDYPLPAIHVVIHTRKFVKLGWITEAERRALNEVYDFDPLVFDFALKRALRVRDADGREHRFPASCFEEHPALSPVRR